MKHTQVCYLDEVGVTKQSKGNVLGLAHSLHALIHK